MVLAALLAATSSLVLARTLVSQRLAGLAVDLPNERSLHERAVPRTGGLAILLGATAGGLLEFNQRSLTLWLAALCLGALSFVDDRHGLPVMVRLTAQFAAAAIVLALEPRWSGLWFAFGLLFVVWMTNLYNFMDGSDGLAGGMAVIGFGSYAVASLLGRSQEFTNLSICVASAALGFLVYNWHPARMFMGDVGSTALGCLAATVGLCGHGTDAWPLWFPLLVFLPFIADATVTLARRALRRERVWQAHREHYYQRLIRSGWDHRRMASVGYLLMSGTGASAVLALRYAPTQGWALLATWLAIIGLLMCMVDARWSHFLRTRQYAVEKSPIKEECHAPSTERATGRPFGR